jgi:carbon storage regulator
MLVLSRKEDQRIMIGDDIVITLVEIRGSKARIGIQAPDGVIVLREEIAGEEYRRGRLKREAEAQGAGDAADVLEYQTARRLAEEREAAEWKAWAEADLATA